MLLRRLHPTRFDGNRNGSYGHPAVTAKVVGVLMGKDRDGCASRLALVPLSLSSLAKPACGAMVAGTGPECA
jgi:hypothetical protein